MTAYARITAGGRTVNVEVECDTTYYLAGHEVDRSGTRRDRWHVIDKSAVTARTPLRMNNRYAELEELPPRPVLVAHDQYDRDCYGCRLGRGPCSTVCGECGCPSDPLDVYAAGEPLPRQEWCAAGDCRCHEWEEEELR